MIGFGELTINETVEAFAIPDLPPGEWGLDQLVGKVKDFIYLLEGLTPAEVSGLAMDELEAFFQEQLRIACNFK